MPSKIWLGCVSNKNFEETHKEQCIRNHSDSSGGMEVIGIEKLRQMLLKKRGLLYMKYLGDGLTKAFDNIHNKKPYGNDVHIEKLECIGHVQ